MGTDITDRVQGLPRVEELFEARVPKGVAVMSDIEGTAEIVEEDDRKVIRVVSAHIHEQVYELTDDLVPIVEGGDTVAKDAILAVPREQAEDLLARKAKSKSKTISKRALASVAGAGPRTTSDGVVTVRDGEIVLRSESEETLEYPVSPAADLGVQSGQLVSKGQQLTAGPLNPQDILRLRGREALQRYVVQQVQSVYRIVGVAVNDKHIEVIVRQMLRRVVIDDAGDSDFLPGTLVDQHAFEASNTLLQSQGRQPATGHWVLLGVTKASLNNDSFLAAASFQDTTRVLTEAVVEGRVDQLYGLKENVIIGKLIPAGTGWQRYQAEALGLPEAPAGLPGGDGDESQQMDSALLDGVMMDGGALEPVDEANGEGAGDGEEDLLASVGEKPQSEAFTDFLAPVDDEPIDETSVETSP
jgi:DNA-directed RNA polymerase subunit beta'